MVISRDHASSRNIEHWQPRWLVLALSLGSVSNVEKGHANEVQEGRSNDSSGETSGNGSIEFIDLTAEIDQGARKWVLEHSERARPSAEDLLRLKAKYKGLKKAVLRDSRNQGMLTELGAVCLELDNLQKRQMYYCSAPHRSDSAAQRQDASHAL